MYIGYVILFLGCRDKPDAALIFKYTISTYKRLCASAGNDLWKYSISGKQG